MDLWYNIASHSQTETATGDAEIQNEYSRQREHLERSVASLRKKLAKDSEIHRADNVRIMQVRDSIDCVLLSIFTMVDVFDCPIVCMVDVLRVKVLVAKFTPNTVTQGC